MASLGACFLEALKVAGEVWVTVSTACACTAAEPAEFEVAEALDATDIFGQ